MIYILVLLLLTKRTLSMANTDSSMNFSLQGPSMHRLIPSAIDLISNQHTIHDVQQRKNNEDVILVNQKNPTINSFPQEPNTSSKKDFVASPFLGEITSEPYQGRENFSKTLNFPKIKTSQSSHSHQYVLPSYRPEVEQDFREDYEPENDLKTDNQYPTADHHKTPKYSVVEHNNEPDHEPYAEPARIIFPHTRYVYDLNHPLNHHTDVEPTPADHNVPKPTAPEVYKIPEGMPYQFEYYKPLKHEEDFRGTQVDLKEQLSVDGFHQPSHQFHFETEQPKKDHKVQWKEYGYGSVVSPVKSLLKFVAALIPLGLFVAALQPNVIQVNSTQSDGNTKQRSLVKEPIKLPGLEMLEKFGFSSLDDPECEKRLFCQFAVLGSKPEGNTSQRGFWQLATKIPLEVVSMFGLADLFKAVRNDSCQTYKCQKNSTLSTSGNPKTAVTK